MAGLAYICVGRRRTGKTTLSKQLLSQREEGIPCMVYDINNEYKEEYPQPFLDFEQFLEKIKEVKGHYILIEEATIFFNGQQVAKDMTNVLVRARHTQNIIQLNFHSFASVPRDIYSLLDYVVVFKTNDSEKLLERFDNDELKEAFLEVRKSKNEFINKTVDLY